VATSVKAVVHPNRSNLHARFRGYCHLKDIRSMNAIIRNSLLALTVAGTLSLAACKTDDSMESSTPPPAESAPPMESTPPDTSTMPPTTPPPTDTTEDDTTTPPPPTP
jgi:hypothetical protein